MAERETAQDIDRIATEWVARMDRAPLSADQAAQLKQWLDGDRRRRGAYMRAKAIWMRSESARALGPQYNPEDFKPAVAPRRRFLECSGALAASFVLVVILVATVAMPTAYATSKGEMRTVPLGGGTTVTLNTDTRIKVYEDDGERRVRVMRGEVLIEAAGATAKTIVDVGQKHLEASGATFVVRKLEDQAAEVLVQEGHVVLAEQANTYSLPPNTSTSLPEGKEWQLTALSFGQMGRELAWREGKIALQGETLAAAIAVYARYSDTPIVIADPELAKLQVTGLFAVNNPLGFSRAVADVFNAEVHQADGQIVIARSH